MGLLAVGALSPVVFSGSSATDRGDKQFSFTTNEAGLYGGIPDDSPTAEYKRQGRAVIPQPSDRPAEQAGVVGMPEVSEGRNGEGKRVVTEPGKTPDTKPLQDSGTALKQGQSAGQVSNVPGTTSTSPNGTSNFFGTGGIPVFPEDLGKK